MKDLLKIITNLQPVTKIVLIICITLIVIASMYFGYFGDWISSNQ